MLFGHGDDYYNAESEIKINFSSNVWYGTELQKLQEHINAQFDVITRYPEPDAGSLKRVIACQLAAEEENVVVTNGSITAFYLIAQAWQGARSTILYPTFSEYEDACRLYEHDISFFSNSADISGLSLVGQDICWICNPNNPDGRIIHREQLLSLIIENRQTLFVIDQAYAAYSTHELLQAIEINEHPNLILVQSISKAYKIPGSRIGYIVASSCIIKKISRYLIPWSVNAFAVETGKYILEHPDQFMLPLQQWQADTANFINRLRELEDLEVVPTFTTFFLVKLKKGKARDLKKYLLGSHGILIRDASNFYGLGEQYIRLSTQKSSDNNVLIDALKEWLLLQ